MFYTLIPQNEQLDEAISSAEESGIQVQAISNIVMITFSCELWKQLMQGKFMPMNTVIFNMMQLHEASGLHVRALLPGNFSLRMDAAKSWDYKHNTSKFIEDVTWAMLALITCNISDCDPHYFI